MSSTTRQVLAYFEQTSEAVSLAELANQLQITPGVLQNILDYWVRKGKLHEVVVDPNVCNTCGIQSACPFVMTLPRYYERTSDSVSATSCSCGSCVG